MSAAVDTSAGPPPDAPPPADTAQPPGDDGWRKDAKGREYVKAVGRSGTVIRKGNETVEEARARDAAKRDEAPGPRKPLVDVKLDGKAPAPTQVDLKELEAALAEAFRSPAMFAAMAGDEWGANHFTTQGPVLARNLVAASKHNPWLRSKLEAAMHGEDFVMQLMTLFPVITALIGYAIPPLIYYLNPGFVPAATRDMFGIPERKEKAPDGPAPAPSPEAAPAAAAA